MQKKMQNMYRIFENRSSDFCSIECVQLHYEKIRCR